MLRRRPDPGPQSPTPPLVAVGVQAQGRQGEPHAHGAAAAAARVDLLPAGHGLHALDGLPTQEGAPLRRLRHLRRLCRPACACPCALARVRLLLAWVCFARACVHPRCACGRPVRWRAPPAGPGHPRAPSGPVCARARACSLACAHTPQDAASGDTSLNPALRSRLPAVDRDGEDAGRGGRAQRDTHADLKHLEAHYTCCGRRGRPVGRNSGLRARCVCDVCDCWFFSR